tara:strand:+ start:2330 stop:2605 length:276 start_codon:yes stop_codon:yes gene_type:complete
MTEDWRFTDERMQLRAAVFRALQHHLDENCRAVYEFCHDWVSQGNNNINNIEHYFQKYLKEVHHEQVYKLEKCLEINPNWFVPIRDDSSSS